MAKKKSSAEKRHRQSEERRLRNKMAKSAVRTSIKKFVVLAQKKASSADGAANGAANAGLDAALKEMIKKIDTATRKGIIKRNTAARKKSRMQRYYNSLQSAQ